MTLNDYQTLARKTALYRYPVIYPVLKLNGEAGELAEKVGKLLRDRGSEAYPHHFDFPLSEREALKAELGDVLWYVAAIATDLGLSLEDVAQANLDKLAARAARGTLQGDGDNR